MPDTLSASTVPPRQRILDAAIACFARSGFHGASMQEICAEAGMSPGALYRYFPSKISIIAAIAEAEREQHRVFFARLAEADDPVAALTSIGIEKLEEMLGAPSAALCAEVMAEAARNPEVRGMFDRNLVEARSHIVAALQRGQATGTVDPALDLDTACQLVMAMGDGLSVHRGIDPTLTPERIRPVLRRLLERLFRLAAIAMCLSFGFAAPSFAQAPAPIARAPAIGVVPAETGSIASTVVLTGTLVAREEVLVSPEIDQLAIVELLAEEGDRVEAGQVLARLSRSTLDATIAQNAAQVDRTEAAIAQARAAIAEAQAAREQADLALGRTANLMAGGNASRELFEQRRAAAQTAAARLDSAQNAIRGAEADHALARAQRQELMVRLAHTDIRAPVAGIVSRRSARLGAVVNGGGDPLFRIIQDGAVELEADVPELLLARLRQGQRAVMDTVAGRREGAVRLVSPEVNRVSRLGRVRVAPLGSDGLVLGSFARATIEVERRDGVLVPLSAVLFQPGGAIVQVVRDGVVDTRPVVVGLRNSTQAEIREGVAAGEMVVATSGTFIRNGDRVVPMPVATGPRS